MRSLRELLKMCRDTREKEIVRSLYREIHDDNVTENITQAAHGFSIGQAVRINSSGVWVLAKADALANSRCIGLVCKVVNADTFWVRRAGILPGEYTPGSDYYLSTATAGALFIQSDPEVWAEGEIREYIGTGDPDGNLVIAIDRTGGNVSIASLQYTILASQSGAAVPTVKVQENTVGAIVPSRYAAGTYRFTLTAAFQADKTSPVHDIMMDQWGNIVTLNRISADVMEVKTYLAANLSVAADGVLNDHYINFTIKI